MAADSRADTRESRRASMVARVIEGGLVVPKGARFAVVASRFNHFVVDRLVEGAVDALVRHDTDPQSVTVAHVPGAWKLPLVSRQPHPPLYTQPPPPLPPPPHRPTP